MGNREPSLPAIGSSSRELLHTRPVWSTRRKPTANSGLTCHGTTAETERSDPAASTVIGAKPVSLFCILRAQASAGLLTREREFPDSQAKISAGFTSSSHLMAGWDEQMENPSFRHSPDHSINHPLLQARIGVSDEPSLLWSRASAP